MLLVFLVVSYSSVNQLLTLSALVCLPVLYTLLWRVAEPPILFFVVSLQWLQVSIAVFDANLQGLTVEDWSSSWTASDAIWLSLLGVLVLAAGIRTAWQAMPGSGFQSIVHELGTTSTTKLWILYVAILSLELVLKGLMWSYPRLSQIFLHFLSLKWVIFFALAVAVSNRNEGKLYLLSAVCCETIIGLTGFFGNYLTVYFALALAVLTGVRKPTIKQVLSVVLCVLLVVYLSVVWSAIKSDYRNFVNLGSGKQVVIVPFESRLKKVLQLHGEMGLSDYEKGVDRLAKRIAYTTYFSYVLSYVPRNVPHENGGMWGAAISHVLLPRLFFPDKPVLNQDTVITEKYTGLVLIEPGGRDTTIPLGYMVESYIDFGRVLMYLPIFLVGALFGVIYRVILCQPASTLLKYGASVAVFLQVTQFGVPTAKLLGGTIMGFVVMIASIKLLFPYIEKYVSVPSQ